MRIHFIDLGQELVTPACPDQVVGFVVEILSTPEIIADVLSGIVVWAIKSVATGLLDGLEPVPALAPVMIDAHDVVTWCAFPIPALMW